MMTLCVCLLLLACSHSRKFTTTYFHQHDSSFHSIKDRFKELSDKHNFSLAFKDKAFSRIGLEILTDTIRYVYDFDVGERRLTDTLQKYRFDVQGVIRLIDDMQRLHCTWITNLDYYENMEKKYLVFVSIRHRQLKTFLRPEKYFTLAFFDRPQRYDARGRLLDNQDPRTLHKINGSLFRKIDQKVCYSLSGTFR
jgi:hypothetical protein